MFRERTFRHLIESKQTTHAFGLHDERPDVGARCGGTVVRNVHAAPFCAVPFQQLAFRIPWFSLWVRRGAVIQNAAVERPCPGPAQRITQPGRVGVIATCHLVTFRRPAAGEDPATAGGGAIIAQLREGAELLAFLHKHCAGGRIGNIRQRLAVALHRHLFRSGLVRRGVVPGHIQHRLRRRTTVFSVHFPQT